MVDLNFSNLLEEGELSFTEFDDGGFCYFTAKEPIKVQWQIWKDPDKNDMRYAHITFDFGMSYECSMEMENNFLLKGYDGINENASLEKRVQATVLFDVMHAMNHCNFDPNYTPFHWAIRGWLKDRLEMHERECVEN